MTNNSLILESDALVKELFNDPNDLATVLHCYNAAMLETEMRLKIIDTEYNLKYVHNPIYDIKCRIKTPYSIVNKMQRKGFPMDLEVMEKNILDIAGVRVICNYIDDIYTVEKMLSGQDDIVVVSRKDYIKNPKPNGYRSLHLSIKMPVYADGVQRQMVPVEVQIRTIAMNFWASLEQKIRYKNTAQVPEKIIKELKKYSETIAGIDSGMQEIHTAIQQTSD